MRRFSTRVAMVGSAAIVSAVVLSAQLLAVDVKGGAAATVVKVDDAQVVTTITGIRLNDILEAAGFKGGKVDEDGGVLIRISNKPVYFTVDDDQESIQAHTAWMTDEQSRPSADKMNDWNRTKRYSKVYFDSDRDPVLQLDLDLAGGVTVARIKDFAFTTQVSITKFTEEVLKKS
jgi:hypothetical protein